MIGEHVTSLNFQVLIPELQVPVATWAEAYADSYLPPGPGAS